MNAAVQDLARLRSASASDTADQAPAFDRSRALLTARRLLAPALQERDAPAYPVDALGPLAAVAQDIAREAQIQPALVGQSVLGAASLLTQGLFDVRTGGGIRPLSLYLLTLADSGDGKSTADGVAMAAVKAWQKRASASYRAERSQFDADLKKAKKGDPIPEEPRSPYRLVRDVTVEGLRRDLNSGPSSQGVFTDEAAALLGGYGMNRDNKQKTASAFSGLWDSGDLSVSRSTGGRVEMGGRRLAMHWLIQPHAAAEALGDPMLSSMGFWPRFLLAWPAPCAPRRFRPFRPELLASVGAFWRRCDELLGEPLPDEDASRPLIEPDEPALEMMGAAFERLEQEGRLGRLRVVKSFAVRATEQAYRVAAVLAAWSGRDVIRAEEAQCALELVRYSIATWRAVIDEGGADPTGNHALRLFEWLTDAKRCPGWRCQPRYILTRGPAALRSRDRRDAALALLEDAGLIERDGSTIYARDPSDDEADA